MTGEQHRQRDTERGKGIGNLVLWASFVLVAYVLSIGPAALLHRKTASAGLKTVLEFSYVPVEFLIKETPLRPVGDWWISLGVEPGS